RRAVSRCPGSAGHRRDGRERGPGLLRDDLARGLHVAAVRRARLRAGVRHARPQLFRRLRAGPRERAAEASAAPPARPRESLGRLVSAPALEGLSAAKPRGPDAHPRRARHAREALRRSRARERHPPRVPRARPVRQRLHRRPRRPDPASAVGRRAGDAQDRADRAVSRQSRSVLRRTRGLAKPVRAVSEGEQLYDDEPREYDAILVVSFGGPEGPDDGLPFLDTVFRGLPVREETKAKIAERYALFGGVSPINAQTREFIAALRAELDARGPALPIYWGNRNWHPYLAEAFEKMSRDGVRRVLAYVTSVFSSYSSCRKYRENLYEAAQTVPTPPVVDRLRSPFNHPLFIEAVAGRVTEALNRLPPERRDGAPLLFTAHSL